MKTFLYPAEILIPKSRLDKWSVIACDQYTSDRAYWDKVQSIVGDFPSSYNVTLPEIFLSSDNSERIAKINDTMEKYLKEDLFLSYKDVLIYVERRQRDGRVRRGIVGAVDLEDYSYERRSNALIRASEATVPERIPPRVAIRRDASLELPHAMLLFNDPENTVIGLLQERQAEFPLAYDFDLMLGGGHVTGRVIDKATAAEINEKFSFLVGDRPDPMLFAVGDGNHSLACAKECYLQSNTEKSRYALVEVVNIHDPALTFEPIFRVVFNTTKEQIEQAVSACFADGCATKKIPVTLLYAGGEKEILLPATDGLPVGCVQSFLSRFLADHPACRVDYIHGKDDLKTICQNDPGAVGFLFETMDKSRLMETIEAEGSLTRKAFSMGEAYDKRYYLETRKIK